MNKNILNEFAVAGFLYNPKTKSVLLHLRDGNTIFNPNKWALFGGLAEGKETPSEAFIRELYEEINLKVESKHVIPLTQYVNETTNMRKHTFFVISDIDISLLKLGEGAGFEWIQLSNLNEYDLTVGTKRDLSYFVSSNLHLH